jgi:2-oxo-4-hydroxy-4-carboxy--5-ureidoimidazoline (OHCU) decarboxylase
MPAIAEIDALEADGCAGALAPLFEGAPRFLERLCAARPFGTAEALFAQARLIAHGMPEDEQVELIDAHPRLGAPPGSVSPLSYTEQGYDRETAEAMEQLRELNHEYERRFGFRYCTFVAGRPRAALVPELRERLTADRTDELRLCIDAVVDIARDRYDKLASHAA